MLIAEVAEGRLILYSEILTGKMPTVSIIASRQCTRCQIATVEYPGPSAGGRARIDGRHPCLVQSESYPVNQWIPWYMYRVGVLVLPSVSSCTILDILRSEGTAVQPNVAAERGKWGGGAAPRTPSVGQNQTPAHSPARFFRLGPFEPSNPFTR